MGTNYYAKTLASDLTGAERLHIGKSSGGWCFHLHVIADKGLNDLPDWKNFLSGKGVVIQDEYGDKIPLAKMLDIIENRKASTPEPFSERHAKGLPGGYYESVAVFHEKNFSEDGPNGLVRSKIDGNHCIGHGAGTWDLCPNTFS